MDTEGIRKDFIEGKIKSRNLELMIWEKVFEKNPEKWPEANTKAAAIRLEGLENRMGKKFNSIRDNYVDNSSMSGGSPTTGIEQKIGGAVVPLGLIGPIRILGDHASGEFYLPLATNEAALVAGINRGFKAVNESGGIRSIVVKDHMTRAPLIETPDPEKAKEISNEILKKGELFQKMKKAAEAESRVSKLMDIQPFQIGRRVHIRFYFQTGDSMGMNSATKYSSSAVRVLKERYQWVKMKSLTGNMCTDKKASHMNVLLGRGKSVETQIKIKRDIIRKVFRVEPEAIVELNYLKNYQGSSLAGTMSGFNANVANTVAAMFIATGQDCAQIAESSSCFVHAEIDRSDPDNLIFGVTMPCLEIATVGGGTGFGTAKECLEMLGCHGPGDPPGTNARKLAEIIGAAVTAQDLNLIATEASNHELAESHMRLARGK
jgi:hydroxymethylglutaryl-CoA reductase (NADPH)